MQEKQNGKGRGAPERQAQESRQLREDEPWRSQAERMEGLERRYHGIEARLVSIDEGMRALLVAQQGAGVKVAAVVGEPVQRKVGGGEGRGGPGEVQTSGEMPRDMVMAETIQGLEAVAAKLREELEATKDTLREAEVTKDAQITALKANLDQMTRKEERLRRSLEEERRKEEEQGRVLEDERREIARLSAMLDQHAQTKRSVETQVELSKDDAEQVDGRHEMATKEAEVLALRTQQQKLTEVGEALDWRLGGGAHGQVSEMQASTFQTQAGIALSDARGLAWKPPNRLAHTGELHANIVNFLSKADAVILSAQGQATIHHNEPSRRSMRSAALRQEEEAAAAAATTTGASAAEYVPVWRAPSATTETLEGATRALVEARRALALKSSERVGAPGTGGVGASIFLPVPSEGDKLGVTTSGGQGEGKVDTDNGEKFVTVWSEHAPLPLNHAASGGAVSSRVDGSGSKGVANGRVSRDDFVCVWNREGAL
jgi:hypothetical protein